MSAINTDTGHFTSANGTSMMLSDAKLKVDILTRQHSLTALLTVNKHRKGQTYLAGCRSFLCSISKKVLVG
jgi:hypothetical protein